jgi:hypothetical protein
VILGKASWPNKKGLAMALQAVPDRGDELLFADEMEREFRLPQSTWRYWAATDRFDTDDADADSVDADSVVVTNKGPRSFLLGRRRVWRRSDVESWLAARERLGARKETATK